MAFAFSCPICGAEFSPHLMPTPSGKENESKMVRGHPRWNIFLDGKIITTLPLAGGSDGAVFNLTTMEAFSLDKVATSPARIAAADIFLRLGGSQDRHRSSI